MTGNDSLTISQRPLSVDPCGIRYLGDNEVLVSLSHVSMGWNGRKVLEDVSLEVHRGDFIAITGPNGGGKTTLLKLILGLYKPVRGTVTRPEAGVRIGYLPQKNMVDSHFPITTEEVIRSGLLNVKGLSQEDKDEAYRRTMDAVGLKEHASKAIGTLSGGQLQRALLGRAIISCPDILVLDEPLSYIDKPFEARLYSLISDIAKTTTIILVSHEMSKIASMANRHFIVDRQLRACSAEHHNVYYECD